ANLALFRLAATWNADLVLTHHGLFWEVEDPAVNPAKPFDERRARFLTEHGMSLAAYHLPLDAHPEVGNNAALAHGLGLTYIAHDFGDLSGTEVKVGVSARADPPISVDECFRRCERLCGQPVRLTHGGPELIETIGIISGGATSELYSAIDRGFDAFLTGEGREWAVAVAEEGGIHFLAAGHYATEVFGVRALGRWLTENYGLETRYFAIPNPY
ncbi:MAG: Nif3-like dinuclear metal center hexameric protein, partial [Chloroflexota bacterium]|nr:Nif3-like dinuclear metal center hexameric protein [Chloroflexota bacterium]